MRKRGIVLRIGLILIISETFDACIMDKKTTFYIKNCTSDTLLINLSGADTLADWKFWNEQMIDTVWTNITGLDAAFNLAISSSLTLPDSITFVNPYIYNEYDTCYIYTIKWDIAKQYSIYEIREKKMYNRQSLTKSDFNNRMYKYCQ